MEDMLPDTEIFGPMKGSGNGVPVVEWQDLNK